MKTFNEWLRLRTAVRFINHDFEHVLDFPIRDARAAYGLPPRTERRAVPAESSRVKKNPGDFSATG